MDFTFETSSISFFPGQYMRVTIPDLRYADDKNFRDFSIVPSPDNAQDLRIIFRNSDSGFKRSLFDAPEGTKVKVTGPFGNFVLPTSSERPIIFIAGGIGITPFLSMLEYVYEQEAQYDISMLLVTQSDEKSILANEITSRIGKKKLRNFKSVVGEITAAAVVEATLGVVMPLWYIAGPPRMVATTRAILHTTGVENTDIFTEQFLGYDREARSTHTREQTSDQLAVARNSALIQALNNTAIVSMTDVDGNIIFANDKLVEISKYSLDELIGQNHRLLKSDHHPLEFFRDLWQTILAGKVWRGEIKNRAKDGSYYWVDSSLAPIFNEDGQISHFITVRFPITEKKELEEALERSERRFRQLFDLAPDGIFVADTDGRYTDVNKAGCILLGRTRDDILGKTIVDLIPEKDIPRLWEQRKLLATRGVVITTEWYLRKFDGSFAHVEVSASILDDGRWLGFVRDITDRKRAEAEMLRARQEWVMIVAHDLRQPVQRIALASELLHHTEKNLSPDGLRELADIDASIIGLIRLTEDLFDAARLDSKQVVLSVKQIDMRSLVETLAKRFQQSSGRNVNVSAPDAEVFSVRADPQRVEQVLSNLLSNAIKYSAPEFPIEVELSTAETETTCAVSNYGKGLTEEEQKNLFLRFYRVPGSEKIAKGSGLGLYISKGLIEAHGGHIWATSAPGHNQKTTFAFTLPKSA